MFIQEEEIRYYNQADGLIAIQSFPIIRAERRRRSRVARTARRSRPPIPTTRSLKLTRNSNRRSLGAPRQDIGTLPRSATRSTPWPRGLLTLPDMNAWLMAIGSPHVRTGTYWLEYRKASPKVSGKDPATAIPQAVERVHWADYMAAEIGLPAAYDYRSQRGAYALHRATNWVARVAGPDNRTVFRPTEMSVVVRQAIPKPGGRPAIVPVEGRSRGTESPLWLRTECSLEHHRSHTWNRPQSGIE
jgi:hypothetical protein